MGRAGAGGGGGGHSSGGHSGGSRSSGGHSVGGSSRAGGGGRSGGGYGGGPGGPGGGMGGPGGPGGPGGYGGPPPRRRRGGVGCFTLIIVLICVCVMTPFYALKSTTLASSSDSSSITASTYAREKLDLGISYDKDCVIDELGWIESVSGLENDLEYFYEETGIQPFIYLKAYDSSLSSDAEKLAYAEEWYEENIDNEATFLYIYFADEDESNVVGYMCYVNGTQISSVMDSEAIEIFWDYIDTYWYTDLDTDEMFATVFEKTADRIMAKTTTTADVLKIVAIIVLVIVITVCIIIIINKKRRAEAERAAETERILNTSIDDLAK